jgi:predicted lipid-binding transport protein (Tim44 family)
MKRTFALLVAFVSVIALLQPDDAAARRIGGGRSLGAQRSITPAPAPSTTAPSSGIASNPVMPAPSGVTPARPAVPAAAPSGASRWLGPIAGIAAGLGLAALFAHFGMSEAFGSVLLLLLGVAVVAFIVRALLARSAAPPRYAPQPAGGTLDRVEPTVKRFEPAWNGATPTTSTARRFPPGFDPVPFAAEAKRQFNRLQAAYDRRDRSMLADVLTPEMLEEISRDLDARGPHVATEVVSLDAEVLDVATEGDKHWASVRFTGKTREDGKPVPEPFDEVWNLVKPVDGSSGWRLAGIQQYA